MTPTPRFTEISPPGQQVGNTLRRWFTSETLDLIVWLEPDAGLQAFQFCYGKPLAEKALEWRRDGGLRHLVVDDGSRGEMGHKRSPLLRSGDAAGSQRALLLQLDELRDSLPPDIYRPVREKLEHADD